MTIELTESEIDFILDRIRGDGSKGASIAKKIWGQINADDEGKN